MQQENSTLSSRSINLSYNGQFDTGLSSDVPSVYGLVCASKDESQSRKIIPTQGTPDGEDLSSLVWRVIRNPGM